MPDENLEVIDITTSDVPENVQDFFTLPDTSEVLEVSPDVAASSGDTPAAPLTGDSSPSLPSESAPQVPDWLASIPADEQQGVLESWLSRQTPEQIAALGPVSAILGQVQANTANYVAQQQQQQAAQAERDALMEETATSFVERLQPYVDSSINLSDEANNLVEWGATHRQADLVTDLQGNLMPSLRRAGIDPQNIPQNYLSRINAAPTLGGVFGAYADMLTDAGYSIGYQKAQQDGGKRMAGDEVANKARYRNEILAELAKEGRLRDSVPPVITGSQAGMGGGTMDEQEFERLVGGDLDDYAKNRERIHEAARVAMAGG